MLPYGCSYKASCAVPDRVKPSFVIFDIRTLWCSVLLYPYGNSRCQRVNTVA